MKRCIILLTAMFFFLTASMCHHHSQPPTPPTPPPALPVAHWQEITGGQLHTVGESLFYMKEFKNKLYGATESSGKIVRFNGIAWNQIFDTEQKGHGRWINSYHLGVYENFMYTGFRNFYDTPTSIRIYRTDGAVWSHVHQEMEAKQVRFIQFGNSFVTMLSSYSPVRSKLYKKTDSNSRDIGNLVATTPYWLYGDPIVYHNQIYFGGEGIYKIDANFNIQKVYNTGSGHCICAIHLFNGVPHAVFNQGFRATSGPSCLLREKPDGSWEVVKYFPEPEGWCMEVYNGKLYLGTRKEGGGGKVYELDKNYNSKVVGTTKADGFFSLRKFQGKLFAGTYSLSQVRSYMFWYK